MTPQTSAPAPSTRANRFPGPCKHIKPDGRECGLYVRAGKGVLVSRDAAGLRCPLHASVIAPAAPSASASKTNGGAQARAVSRPPVAVDHAPERPEVSRGAMDLALATYQRARDDADAPEIAKVLAWEIVAALAFCRGETIDRSRLDADASTRPEHADAAASIVDDLLATRAGTSVAANNASGKIAIGPHATDAEIDDLVERAEIEREQAERAALPPSPVRAPAPRTAARASKPRASKASAAGNPFAHRVKGK